MLRMAFYIFHFIYLTLDFVSFQYLHCFQLVSTCTQVNTMPKREEKKFIQDDVDRLFVALHSNVSLVTWVRFVICLRIRYDDEYVKNVSGQINHHGNNFGLVWCIRFECVILIWHPFHQNNEWKIWNSFENCDAKSIQRWVVNPFPLGLVCFERFFAIIQTKKISCLLPSSVLCFTCQWI